MNGPAFSTSQFNYSPANSVTGIDFRLAQGQDLEMLWDNCYPQTDWPRFQDHYNHLLKWQENGRCYILIAETLSQMATKKPSDSPQIIGSAQLIRQSDRGEIAELVVCEPYRNRGIGTAMIQILIQLAGRQNLNLLEIGVSIENKNALRLYRRLGFTRERQVQLPNSEEAIFLSKDINTGGLELAT